MKEPTTKSSYIGETGAKVSSGWVVQMQHTHPSHPPLKKIKNIEFD
jgi:hypothetical protein